AALREMLSRAASACTESGSSERSRSPRIRSRLRAGSLCCAWSIFLKSNRIQDFRNFVMVKVDKAVGLAAQPPYKTGGKHADNCRSGFRNRGRRWPDPRQLGASGTDGVVGAVAAPRGAAADPSQ